MTDLGEILAQARNATALAAEQAQNAATYMQTLRADILAGGSTGDPIQDYLIVKFRVIDEKARERYVAISEKLKGKTGELIAIHFKERVVTRHRFVGPSDYEDVDRIRLAILTGDVLQFSIENGDAFCTLPIDSYASEGRTWTVISGTFYEIHEGKIFMADDCGEPIVRMSGASNESWQPLNLVIGDEAVMEWNHISLYRLRNNRERFAHLLEQLGRLTLTAEEDPVEE